jgi:hypothetical protein
MGTGGGMTAMCPDEATPAAGAAGMGAGGSAATGSGGAAGSYPIDREVPAIACSGDGVENPRAIDRYSQGYKPVQADADRAMATVNGMSVADLAAQMRGIHINAFNARTSNIQHSEDTATIRGFRYRDASRGMNLGEDFWARFRAPPWSRQANVGFSTVVPGQHGPRRGVRSRLEYAIGEAIGDEMQAAKETLLLAPCMNLLRHPLWGARAGDLRRGPVPSSAGSPRAVVGIQQHIAANAKHFMAYNIEYHREQQQLAASTSRRCARSYAPPLPDGRQDGGVAFGDGIVQPRQRHEGDSRAAIF